MAIIEITSLSKHYRNKQALDSLDLTLDTGRIVGLVGPNGSGKTTLLRILGGFDQAYEGQVRVGGFVPGHESRALTSYLPDHSAMPEWMTAEQTIETYREFFPDFDAAKARDMLAALKLDGTQRLREMSKGMKEKIQIMLIMSRSAKIYLLDEPISAVDPASRKQILQSIISNYAEDSLLFISTHLLHDIEPIIDEVIFLDDGRLKLQEDTDQLRSRTGKDLTTIFEEVYS